MKQLKSSGEGEGRERETEREAEKSRQERGSIYFSHEKVKEHLS